jgi:PHD/YefM family antitoxin component YafN of YafNO toxin-antitoxin module
MELKKLEVPTTSITEVKKSPMDVFSQAREAGTAVYVFNREKIAGVMLTQEQYETLLQELHELRARPNQQPIQEVESEQVSVKGMEDFSNTLRKALITGSTMSAKNVDERMDALGFITKKTGFGGVIDMIHELNETGKLVYQLRKKSENKTITAEIIAEHDNNSHLFDKLIIRKIYLKTI